MKKHVPTIAALITAVALAAAPLAAEAKGKKAKTHTTKSAGKGAPKSGGFGKSKH